MFLYQKQKNNRDKKKTLNKKKTINICKELTVLISNLTMPCNSLY